MNILEEWDDNEFLFETDNKERLTAEFESEIKDDVRDGQDRDHPSEEERGVTITLGVTSIVNEDGDFIRHGNSDERLQVIQCLTDHFSND